MFCKYLAECVLSKRGVSIPGTPFSRYLVSINRLQNTALSSYTLSITIRQKSRVEPSPKKLGVALDLYPPETVYSGGGAGRTQYSVIFINIYKYAFPNNYFYTMV